VDCSHASFARPHSLSQNPQVPNTPPDILIVLPKSHRNIHHSSEVENRYAEGLLTTSLGRIRPEFLPLSSSSLYFPQPFVPVSRVAEP
jgi:hypothetical protein